jgi:coenzyme F420 hydrogenase subunit beta
LKKLDENIAYQYFGNFKNGYLACASDPSVRQNAASGGTVSAILIYLLENKLIDGALVCRTTYSDDDEGIGYEFIIARTREEVLSAQTSKYFEVYFMREALPLIRNFVGKLAVVALPCDIKNLHYLTRNDKELSKKIEYVLCLFCGHNSKRELLSRVLAHMQILEKDIDKFYFRVGHWRGKMYIRLRNGNEFKFPSARYLLYQNLYFFAQRKCLYCNDHIGYYSDISFGDVWDYRLKNNTIKYSSVVTKTQAGEELLISATKSNFIHVQNVSIQQIFQGQKRSLPFHHNINARSKAGSLIGISIPIQTDSNVRWNDFLVALCLLMNYKISTNSKFKQMIFKVPRPILQFYLYFIKLLQSI